MNASPLDKVLAAIGDCKQSGKGYLALCPAHDDHNPSLSIMEADDGKVLLKCFSQNCKPEDITKALGLAMTDLFDTDKTQKNTGKNGIVSDVKNGKAKKKSFPTAREAIADLEKRYGKRSNLWTYHDAAGKPIGVVVRWDNADGTKKILPVSLVDGDWANVGMPKPRLLYRLPELLGSPGPAFVVEGEKAADALAALGFSVTTSAHGSNSAKETDWTPLADREIILLPDHDAPGQKYARVVASLAPAMSVKILNLPGLPEGGDVFDYIAARRKAGLGDDAICLEIDAMVSKLESIPKQDRITEAPATPKIIIEPYSLFPVELLPEPIRGYVIASSIAIGCDSAMIALPILAALASAIGNNRCVVLKRSWVEPAILWALVIALSGTQKSPGFDKAVLPVRERKKRIPRKNMMRM